MQAIGLKQTKQIYGGVRCFSGHVTLDGKSFFFWVNDLEKSKVRNYKFRDLALYWHQDGGPNGHGTSSNEVLLINQIKTISVKKGVQEMLLKLQLSFSF